MKLYTISFTENPKVKNMIFRDFLTNKGRNSVKRNYFCADFFGEVPGAYSLGKSRWRKVTKGDKLPPSSPQLCSQNPRWRPLPWQQLKNFNFASSHVLSLIASTKSGQRKLLIILVILKSNFHTCIPPQFLAKGP